VGELDPGAPVTVLETAWVSGALGLLCLPAAERGIDGAPRDELAARVRDDAAGMQLLATTRRSSAAPGREERAGLLARLRGRPPTAHDAGLLALEAGAFRPIAEPMPSGEVLARLVAAVAQRPPAGADRIAVMSGDADGEAAALATFLHTRHHPEAVWLAPADPVLLLAAGPGCVGVAFRSGAA
jgi:fatty acid-binding protein DegV